MFFNRLYRRAYCLLVLCVCLISAGCIGKSSTNPLDLRSLGGSEFLVTVNAGGGTGSYSVVSQTDWVYKDIVAFATTDLGVTVYNDSIFVFGKYGADWLARFELGNTRMPVYQYSLVGPEEESRNPRDIVIVNNDVGYVFRYSATTSWIIDPSPQNEASFKIGSIDLEPYMTGSNPPNPVQAVIDGTAMYVLLEQANGWMYDLPGKLLEFDISTPATPVIVDELTLKVISPNIMVLYGTDLYIAGWGILGWSKDGHTPVGGIEKVDTLSMSSVLLVDDDDGTNTFGNPYTYDGATMDIAVVSDTVGFIYFAEWNDPAVYKIYKFNPATGAVDDTVAVLDGINLSKIAQGPDGLLYCSASAWFGIGTAAGIYTVDTATLEVTGPVSVGLEPIGFAFGNN